MVNSQGQSIRAERRERELALRRADLIAAASKAFAERGFSGVQVSEIAEAAGLSLTSVYSMFGGKEDLYQEVITHMAETIQEGVRKRVDGIPNARERLLCVVEALFACFEENRGLLRLFAQGTQGLPWKIRQAMGEVSIQILHGFTEWVISIAEQARREGQLHGLDPESVALAVTGAVSSKAAHWIDTKPERPLAEAAPGTRALFERLFDEARAS
jgi:AcrR family transcriptional regulator